MTKLKKPKRTFAYCWKLEDGSLCFWAEATRNPLKSKRPSEGSKVVRVELVELKKSKKRS